MTQNLEHFDFILNQDSASRHFSASAAIIHL